MNCREALQHLYDYLDKELTDDMVRKIENHLSTCDHCLDKFEFEKLLHEMLAKKGQVSVDAEPLKAKVMERIKQLESEGDSAGFFNRYRPYIAAATAVVLVIVGLFTYLKDSDSKLFAAFVKCHSDTDHGDTAQMTPAEIESCLKHFKQLPDDLLLSASDRNLATAVEADYEGEQALHLTYHPYRGADVSIFVIADTSFTPRHDMQVVNHGQKRYMWATMDDTTVLLWKCHNVWCAAVSTLDAETLISFVSTD
jgi:anti-sigma factor (TIGR02949 family)